MYLFICLLSLCAVATSPQAAESDAALNPPPVLQNPGDTYAGSTRSFQGIPGIARTGQGRLFATWYGGGPEEGPDNYVMLVRSDDDGVTWTEPFLIIDPPGKTRAYDPCLWMDPDGRVWLFWAQAWDWWDGRAGVWAICSSNPDAVQPDWTEPRRLCNGIMMNKPTVLSTGEWLLPAAVWNMKPRDESYFQLVKEERGSNVICSLDHGQTWTLRGQARVPNRSFDEHMLVELRDGRLWMLVRTRYGIGESFSSDRGKTWTRGRRSKTVTHGTSARFFIRRLASGNLLLVKHAPPSKKGRSHLTAFLSKDDGKTWEGGLLLDERSRVSYPDGVQAPDGTVYLCYDYDRRGAKQILMAVFHEQDVLAGKVVSDACRFRVQINQATGTAADKS